MARNLNPQCKQCRREGVKLFLKGDRCNSSKCSLNKRNFVPGMHGPKIGRGGSRLTGYGAQLREKQKAKKIYGVLESQFHRYFSEAKKKKGNTGEILVSFLETRLDNVVCQAGFAVNRNIARQLVGHGHVLVNGKKATIPSMKLKIKDVVSIKPASLKKPVFAELESKIKQRIIPEWLSLDIKRLEATVVDSPKLEQVKPVFDVKAIVEFYSK